MSNPNSLSDPSLDHMLRRVLTPTRWDQVIHAPFCDARTNELICIYLELARIVSMMNPPLMYAETLEPFFLYSINRLNSMFNTDIRVRLESIPAQSQADGYSETPDSSTMAVEGATEDLGTTLVTL